jgi:nitroimidazol reductase NimA-like FMN-containing flavoprotein (pyridoxamine 5'-phosphate oxidase superfamily)
MRVARKEIQERKIIEELLAAEPVGRLGTIGEDGYPMIKPLNFVYHQGIIYFHSAMEGEKIEAIRRDSRVCFEVDLPIAYAKNQGGNPCKTDYLYRSVIIRGKARLVEDQSEKITALRALMEKYQPEGGYGAFSPEALARTAVVRIGIVEMTGKEDLGKGEVREKALEILGQRLSPPVLARR